MLLLASIVRVSAVVAALALPLASIAAEPSPRFGFSLPAPAARARCMEERELAFQAADAGEWAKAARHLGLATEAFPDSHSDWYDLSCALSRSGDTDGAMRALKRACDLGVLRAFQVNADPDLERLHGTAAYEALLGSLRSPRAPTRAKYAPGDLARSPEELERIATRALEALTDAGGLLGRTQFDGAVAELARWKAASWDSIGARRADPTEREQMKWEAFRCLLNDAMTPLSEHLVHDVMDRAESTGLANSPHGLDVGYAVALARVVAALMGSVDGRPPPEATQRYRSDLLGIAAGAPDQPGLERVLSRLASVTADDLPLAIAIYRRLMRIAADPVAARSGAELEAPGVVLAAEGLPPFHATTTSGTAVTRESFKGRVTLIDLWATWCPPCVAELPAVRDLHATHGSRGLDVLGIAVEEGLTKDPKAFAEWCGKKQVTWPQVLDAGTGSDSVSATLGVTTVPHYLVIDQGGRVVATGGRLTNVVPSIDRLLPQGPVSPAGQPGTVAPTGP